VSSTRIETKNGVSKKKDGVSNYLPYALVGIAVLGAAWGGLAVLGIYTRQVFLVYLSHIPFWMMVGSVGVLLNYLPIAKSKPNVIPFIGIVASVITVVWFCVNDFIKIDDFGEFIGRLQINVTLLVICYCLTHVSLLMLTYRRFSGNQLLAVTIVVVALSGLAYVLVFSGVLEAELAVLSLVVAACLFFIKVALTIVLVVNYLKSPETPMPKQPSTSAFE
jgi:hypothetical protein